MSATAHPPYVKIWAWLVGLFLVSLALGAIGHPVLAACLVFAVAAVKALLVLGYYMHLAFEPRFVLWILLGAAARVAVLFFTLVPDIIYVYGG